MRPGPAARTRPLAALLVVALALVAGACSDDEGGQSGEAASESGGGTTAEVSIVDFDFDPPSIEVDAGTTVTWTNDGDVAHTVQDESDLGAEESKSLAAGDTFEITYDQPGEYPYICGVHPFMKGSVVVK